MLRYSNTIFYMKSLLLSHHNNGSLRKIERHIRLFTSSFLQFAA